MALLYIDGFDTYSNVSDMGYNAYWTTYSNNAPVTGRNGTGFAHSIATSNGATRLALPANTSTVVVGFAIGGNMNGAGFLLDFYDGATAQNSVYFNNSNNSITAYNNHGGTVLGTSAAGVYTNNAWNYVEIKTVTSSTTGSITVRINGGTVLSLTNVNTQVSSNSYTNGIYWGAYQNGGVFYYIDDIYVLDTTTSPGTNPNNNFLGDCSVTTMFPVAAGTSTQFTTPSLSSSPKGIPSSVSWGSTGYLIALPNDTRSPTNFHPCQHDMQVSSITVYHSGVSGSVQSQGVIYNVDPATGYPTTLVSATNIISSFISGANTLTFATNVSLSKGTNYLIGIATSATSTVNYFRDASYDYNFNYWVPTSAPISGVWNGQPSYGNINGFYPNSQVNSINMTVNFTATNYATVQGNNPDFTSLYNYSSTVGATDLFTATSLPSTVGTVYGVATIGAYQKDSSGVRSMAPVIVSGNTTTVLTSSTLATSITYNYNMMNVNPSTSSTWTTSTVNAMQFGYKVVS
jgi:hypothetical protein